MNRNYFTRLISSFFVSPLIAIVLWLVSVVIAIIGVFSLIVIPFAALFGKAEFFVKEQNGAKTKTRWVRIAGKTIGEVDVNGK